MKSKIGCVLILMFFASLPVLAQEEEEVILSSANIQEAELNKNFFRVKPRYRHIDSTHQRSMILIALRPEVRKFPGQIDFVRPRARGIGRSLTLRYEYLLKDYRFSLFAENNTRLHGVDGSGYDYAINLRLSDSRGNEVSNGGEYDANYSSFHIGGRFYYRQRQRVEYGVSGINPFSEYFFFKLRDFLSYARRTTLLRSSNSFLLQQEVEEKKWIMAPGYIEFGWGIQRRIRNRLVVDFYVSAAPQFFGKREHANRDIIVDLGLNIGFSVGKKQKLK